MIDVKWAVNSKNEMIPVKDYQINEFYRCPKCKEEVYLKKGEIHQASFVHHRRAKSKPNLIGESDFHKMGKQQIAKACAKQGLKVEQEVYLHETKQRADVMVWMKDKIIVLEFQCSPISKSMLKQRTDDYHHTGYHVWWILGPKYQALNRLNNVASKFGQNNKYLGIWISFLVGSRVLFYFDIKIDAFGKILYQKKLVGFDLKKLVEFFKSNKQTFIRTSLKKEQNRLTFIEHKIIGSKIDQRYLKVQMKCYQKHYSIMGAPWIAHFPVCNGNREHLNTVPFLNRVLFLLELVGLKVGDTVDGKGRELSFLNLLCENKHLVYKDGYYYLGERRVRWYSDSGEKLNDNVELKMLLKKQKRPYQ
ncbi:competence protein [Pediococcus argentinicus]|uniref:Competence protein n=1 Tax=Pediococcus argentinicus TaxID=480391 RepID=A0A0R2NG59_9LACO|nr:competence protein [Pediococcus argentinicus]